MPGLTVHSVLPDAIYDELRSGILAQVDAPGASFTESAIALRFGVSRPTAKMAIERLVTEGLLRRESHSAARVPELSRDDIVDLFENRATVEGAALARLAEGGTIPAEALAAHRALQAVTPPTPFSTLRFIARSSPASRVHVLSGCIRCSWARSNSASDRCRPTTFAPRRMSRASTRAS
jgi:hypothetical protein